MPIRLNKILRKLNIGLKTANQYLIKYGIDVSKQGLSTKIDDEICLKFLSNFAQDRILKENASELFKKIKNKDVKLSRIPTNKNKRYAELKVQENIIIKNTTTDKTIPVIKAIDIKLNRLKYASGRIYVKQEKTQYELKNRHLFGINNDYIENDPIFNIKTRLILNNNTKTFYFKDDAILQKILNISTELKRKYNEKIKENKKNFSNLNKGIVKMRIRLSMFSYDNLSASLYFHGIHFTYKFSDYIPKDTINYINSIKHTETAFSLEKDAIMYPYRRTLSFPDSFDLRRYIVMEYEKAIKNKHLPLSDKSQYQISPSYPFGSRQYRTEFKIENIEFHDGYYYVSILKDGKKDTSIKSLYVKDRNSYESLSYLTKYFRKRMPNNLAIIYTKDMVIALDHPIMLNNYIKILYENMSIHGEWWEDVQNSNKRTLAHCIAHSNEYKLKKELDLKNAYIDYLSGHQSDKIVIKMYEVIGEHEEDCFIFTQEVDKDHHAIIFENVNIARSSEIFLCEKDSYDDCINYIFNYFTNYGVDTKRMNIRAKAYTAQQFKAVKYKSVNHENLQTWSATIQDFIGEINTSHKIEFISGLRISENPDSRKLTKTELDINHLHNTIMEKLYYILIKRYNKENVGTEIHIGEKRIDLVVKHKNFYDLYEIKTAYDVRTCIRQGFGQIVDYAFFDSQDEIRNMYIVGASIADEKEKDYLHRLRKLHKLNIYYLCPDEI